MDVSFSRAANAYAARMQTGGQQDDADSASGAAGASGGGFGQMLTEAISGAVESQKAAEAVKMEAMDTGRVDMADLVTAISSAELTLNTVVAVRDRVISAYQDILRMPI